MLYFISDTHFKHENILRLNPLKRKKGFEVQIIDNLKVQLKEGDTLYHLGDFAWSLDEELLDAWRSIPGKKILVKGNHDNFFGDSDLLLYFDEVINFSTVVKIREKNVLLCHYPALDLRTFRFKELQRKVEKVFKGSGSVLLLHGHVHWNPYCVFCGCHLKGIRCFNVNVEFNGNRAVSEEELPL
ncbi:MAG: metallophosphoesterase [Desulfurobacteriaceae bacterium]